MERMVELVQMQTLVPQDVGPAGGCRSGELYAVFLVQARCSLVGTVRPTRIMKPAAKRALLLRPQSHIFRTTACRQQTSMFHHALKAGSCPRNTTSRRRRGRGASRCSVMEFTQKTLNHKQRLQLSSAALPVRGRKDGRLAPTRDMQTAARACSLQQRLV